MSITLNIPELAPSLNGKGGLLRMHWTRRKKLLTKWQYLVMAAANGKRHVGPCHITIIRNYASSPLDQDNCYAAAKLPLDALRKCGIIKDDDNDTVLSLSCKQAKVATRKEQGTTIIITEP